MRDTVVKQIAYEMNIDNKIMLITADLGFGIFNEIREKFPRQFMNVGVAEQNMVGIATGLALEGFIVFIYSIANFPTLRCLEQIRNDACYHDANVKILSSGGGFSYGALGMSHHATEDLSILRSLPNLTLIAPSNKWEARMAVSEMIKRAGVSYLRIDKTLASESNVKHSEHFQIGKARKIVEGKDITLIASGGILSEVLKAVNILNQLSIRCRVISMHTVKPLDKQTIIDAVENTGGIITIEENTIFGGLGGAVAEVCLEHSIRPSVFKRIGMNDQYSVLVGGQEYLREKYNMDLQAIITAVKDAINFPEN